MANAAPARYSSTPSRSTAVPSPFMLLLLALALAVIPYLAPWELISAATSTAARLKGYCFPRCQTNVAITGDYGPDHFDVISGNDAHSSALGVACNCTASVDCVSRDDRFAIEDALFVCLVALIELGRIQASNEVDVAPGSDR